MMVHYINILFFALPLNILAHNNNNKPHTTHHTHTNRSLCECELYAPANYDNDPQMKAVMDNFNKQTQQRFHEYDERMKTTRQKCKEQCDKEIQKIILKDKLEKELMDKFTTLETKINTDDIPTCICEKSLADKTEKFCLNCGKNMGVAVPGLGVLGAYGAHSMVQAAIAAGIKFATQEGIKAGTQVGIDTAIKGVISKFSLDTLGGEALVAVITSKTYNQPMFFYGQIMADYIEMSSAGIDKLSGVFSYIYDIYSGDSNMIMKFILENSKDVARSASQAASKMTTGTTEALTAQKTAEATSVTTILSNPIVISFIVVVIIVIILLIIYLILRYRRKKKMKKKLQYIKLLEE
ncbi:rifin PIR protein, putative [Plasmodium reichenowi]|uniref:Rifin PIR protein, putative n=1 Tax=Plasmodium reichenowi TaxID=5854 RepID=A0A2P9DST2_PLARE|nr:rifin PIR protein, putative [Plasmodium reichenowi]